MKLHLAVFVTAFVVSLIVNSAGTEVTGLDVFNSGPFDCDPTAQIRREAEWVNDIGTIRIYNAKLWMGASVNAVADVGMIAGVEKRSVLFHENWDRYANPGSFSVDTLDLAPNYMTLHKGEAIRFLYWCHNFDGLESRGHLIVTIFYGD